MPRWPEPQSITAPCLHCGMVFSSLIKKQRRFCSTACVNNHRKTQPRTGNYVESTCATCGKRFTHHAVQRGRYCSKPCQYEGVGQAQRIPGGRITKACPICGKMFTRKRSSPRERCSRACRAITQRKPPRPSAICEVCDGSFITHPSRKNRFCSWACFMQQHWRGGRLPYYGPSWRAARRAARRRDRVCQDCGVTPHDLGRALDIHHLISFRSFGVERHTEANTLANLIALCNVCHLTREWAANRSHVAVVRDGQP